MRIFGWNPFHLSIKRLDQCGEMEMYGFDPPCHILIHRLTPEIRYLLGDTWHLYLVSEIRDRSQQYLALGTFCGWNAQKSFLAGNLTQIPPGAQHSLLCVVVYRVYWHCPRSWTSVRLSVPSFDSRRSGAQHQHRRSTGAHAADAGSVILTAELTRLNRGLFIALRTFVV